MSDHDDLEHTALDDVIRRIDSRYAPKRLARLEELYRAADVPKHAQITCLSCGHAEHRGRCTAHTKHHPRWWITATGQCICDPEATTW